MYSTRWTQTQRDVVELGERPARCLKGENSDKHSTDYRSRLVAGRAYRGIVTARRLGDEARVRIWGRPPYWFEERLLEKERARTEFERRRVKVRDKKIAALERQQAQLRSILRIP